MSGLQGQEIRNNDDKDDDKDDDVDDDTAMLSYY
jgi:hypothetical protein